MKVFSKKALLYSLAALLVLPLVASPLFGSEERPEFLLKMASLPPDGTSWSDAAHNAADYAFDKTDGKLKIQWYLGGVMGDEPDVVRRMRIGEVHGAVFTLIGLGKILPEVQVLELPALFKGYGEVDYALERIKPTFEKLFEEKGYVLLDWVEVGFGYLFSADSFANLNDISRLVPWLWSGDPVGAEALKTVGITKSVPLQIVEVKVALQMGTINAFGNSFYGCLALQWFPYAKFVLDIPLAYSPGGIVIRKSVYDSFDDETRKIFREGISRFAPDLKGQIRTAEGVAYQGMLDNGMKIVSLPAEEEAELDKRAQALRGELVDKVYPKWLLDEVEAILADYRAKTPGPDDFNFPPWEEAPTPSSD